MRPPTLHVFTTVGIILSLLCLPHSAIATTATTSLNVTALTQQDNLSVLQCWSLEPPFTIPSTGFTGASIANLGGIAGNATYIVQPANSVGGAHNTPAPQWSWFISGLANIQINNSTSQAWITGGRYGLIFAADTATTNGHTVHFPSHDETVILGLPTVDGLVPAHQVLYAGPCLTSELVGI